MGLADLLKFELPINEENTDRDWSWRVRFCAMQGLVRVSRQGKNDSTKDGMRGVAWNLLVRHHSIERDTRVLEALKLAKVEAELDTKTSHKICSNIGNLQSHIAKSLSNELLPKLPPIVTPNPPRPRKIAQPAPKPVQINLNRTSLRQEILLATATYEPPEGYNSRMNSKLMAVIEDQWRKQLHIEQEMEDREKRKREEDKIMGTGKQSPGGERSTK